MKFLEVPREGFIPGYKRSDITDALHEVSGFRTDYRDAFTSGESCQRERLAYGSKATPS